MVGAALLGVEEGVTVGLRVGVVEGEMLVGTAVG